MNKKQPETKWQTLSKTVKTIFSKYFWKFAVILMIIGFSITGFSFSFGKLNCNKDAIIKDKPLKKDNRREYK